VPCTFQTDLSVPNIKYFDLRREDPCVMGHYLFNETRQVLQSRFVCFLGLSFIEQIYSVQIINKILLKIDLL